MRSKGFTLIELLIVIAIVAVLAGAMVPMFRTTRREAQEAKVHAELDAIKTAAIMYHHDLGKGNWPPVSTTGVDFITDSAPTSVDWNGPYLDAWRVDPWLVSYAIYNSGGTARSVQSTGGGASITLIITPDVSM